MWDCTPVKVKSMAEVANTTNRGVFNTIGGNIVISGDVIFDPNLRTLTCISTGGPATTVTWTRDSTTVTEGTDTVLNDAPTANYTHTLLSVSIGGEYRCTVANSKPSTASASITLGKYGTVSRPVKKWTCLMLSELKESRSVSN